MKRTLTTFIATLALVALGAGAHPAGAAGITNAVAAAGTTNIVASSDGKFTPSTIVMHVGKTTTLHLTSSGGVHGLVSNRLHIPLTRIQPGKTVSVAVTPTKAGTYVLPCAIFCGLNHANMKLTVIVKQ